jgi:hypothetical protein
LCSPAGSTIKIIKEKEMKDYEKEKEFYKEYFNLSAIPEVLSQCCHDFGCTTGLLEVAQQHLNNGKIVVLKLFGNRKNLYDSIKILFPGYIIDIEYALSIINRKW